MKYLMILMVFILASCQSTKEDSHAHNPDGSHVGENAETPTVDYTVWTDKTELFVEFPVLVVGQTSRFAAHFTILDKHQAVQEGSVTVSLIQGNKGVRHTVESPSSVGIFKPSLQPKEAGIYQLVFELKTPQLTDKIVLDKVQVFENLEQAKATVTEEENGGAITFLKEQAWKMEFQTAAVSKEAVYSIIPTSGLWKSSAANFKTLIATGNGTVQYASTSLTVGSKVKKGQTLMLLSSNGLSENNLDTEVANAKANYEQAKAEFERKQQLYADKIISKSDFETVTQKFERAKNNFESLSSNYSKQGKKITAPFDGFIASNEVKNGQFVEQGATLFSITTNQASVVEAQVSTRFVEELQSIQDVWVKTNNAGWVSMSKTNGKVLSVGKSVSSEQPMLSVFTQITPFTSMPEGSFCEVQIAVGKAKNTLVIPTSALLEDYGKYAVIVQTSGESFERRNIQIGAKNGSMVEVLKGLAEGEMVVSTGAYQVKMASMSGQVPAHGHSH